MPIRPIPTCSSTSMSVFNSRHHIGGCKYKKIDEGKNLLVNDDFGSGAYVQPAPTVDASSVKGGNDVYKASRDDKQGSEISFLDVASVVPWCL